MIFFSIRIHSVIIFLATIFATHVAYAQVQTADSLKTHTLDEVEVTATLRTNVVRSVLPIQALFQKEFLTLNAANVADVVNTFSGVTLKDYGGIGGMKTVSVRGMDSRYTSVSYDGVMMGNIQSGQIDLGRFAIDNIAEIALTNAQPTDFLQSARLFSNASVLNLQTLLPDEKTGAKAQGKAYMKAGSFGLVNPGILLMKNIGKKAGISFSADYINANGQYSFLQNYGISAEDSSAVLRRKNSDVQSLRSELNIVYRSSPTKSLLLKSNLFLSERGLPGSITFYNEEAAKERLKDTNLFTQVQYKNRTWGKLQYSLTARHHYTRTFYTDRSTKYTNLGGLLTNRYTQNEYYASAAAATNLRYNLIASAAFDTWMNQLDIVTNMGFSDFPYPTRYTTMANLAVKYFTNHFNAGANVLHTATFETAKIGNTAENRSKFSPTINIAFQLMEDKEYHIRAFYKNLYRLPTFNELYYQDIGNKNLIPENANMVNIGFTCSEKNIFNLLDVTFTADAYYNRVTDKIVMLPKNGFFWSMTNRDKATIVGVDATVTTTYPTRNNHYITVRGNYSFQSAKDKTPGGANYREQLPYMPEHFGTASITYTAKKWEAGYNFMFSGVRWIGQMTERRNRMNPYTVHSLFAQTDYKNWQLKGEVINLLNTQYEVVKFYPMPRRNYRFSLIYNF